jgi:aryl-alcohol dehydrogenase-like predicted oxidoreductase
MKIKTFGKTGKKVFVLGLGTYGHGEAYGGIGKENSINVMKKVVEKFSDEAYVLIDTAPRYGLGEVEEWIGELFEKSNEKVLITTKGGRHIDEGRVNEKDFSSNFLREDLNNSLKRLKTNKIFLYQLHNPNINIIKEGKVFDLLESFKEEGKIDWYGISINVAEEGIEAINYCEKNNLSGLTSIQIIYNALQRENYKELFKLAKNNNIAIIAREPILRGFLTNKYSKKDDFEKYSAAVKKQIKLFGKNQLFFKLKELKDLLEKYNISSMTEFAIKFSILDENITVSIPGINREEYIYQDLSAVNLEIDEELLEDLSKISDLKK